MPRMCPFSSVSMRDGARRDLDALGNRTLNLSRERGHIGGTAAVEDAHFLCAKSDSRTDCVHRYISAAHDGNFLTCQIRIDALSYIPKETDCGHNTLCVFAFDAKLLIGAGTDGDQNRVIGSAVPVQ